MVSSDWRMLLYFRPWHLGFLGDQHPLASFLSSVDVHRHRCAGLARESMGILHWSLCRWLVGLREYLCNQLLLQWVATAFSMDSYGAFGSTGFSYRSACMVFKSASHHRMCVGLFPATIKRSGRCGQIRTCLRPHNWVLRFRYGSLPTSLSWPLSSNVAPAPALTGYTCGGY